MHLAKLIIPRRQKLYHPTSSV